MTETTTDLRQRAEQLAQPGGDAALANTETAGNA